MFHPHRMTCNVYSTGSVRLWTCYNVYHLVCCSHSGGSCITFMKALGIQLFPHPINIFVSSTTSNVYHAMPCDCEWKCPHVWIWVWGLSLNKNTPLEGFRVCFFLYVTIFVMNHVNRGKSIVNWWIGFWLMTECRLRAYAILICLSSSSLSLSSLLLLLSSVSTPPDHMLGQIRFILCMHMQLYPV